MMNRIAYMSILILLGCNSLIEKTAPLEGEFYIQDGWLAFSAAKYEEADKHFNTAIETNDSGSVFHFLSLVGLGWTNIYKAQAIEETSSNGFVKIAGENLSAAHNIMHNINIEDITLDLHGDYYNGRSHMFAALALQRSYYAKQLAVNGVIWETINVALSDMVRILYEESVEFSEQLESDFVFQHDLKLKFNDILILRTENYLILGNIEEAILSYGQIDFDQLGFEVNEECIQGIEEDCEIKYTSQAYCDADSDCIWDEDDGECGVDASTLVECLCLVSHNGTCPFGD